MSFDINGILGSGQSLSVGAPFSGTAVVEPMPGPTCHLKLSLDGARVPPWDPEQPGLALVPYSEPIRPLGTEYPSPYPDNLFGETLHAAITRQLSALTSAAGLPEHVTVHSVVGECGQGMAALSKHSGDTTGTTGRSYAAAIFEVAAIARLARATGRSYGVRALVMTHGETDWQSPTYERELVELMNDLNRDVPALTGQSEPVVMLLSQQFAFPTGRGERPLGTLLQWRLGVERPGAFVCTGPRYHLAGAGDGIHLLLEGYRALGEKTAEVYFERCVMGRDWRPLQPTAASRDGRVVTVHFHVPVPPLAWDDTLPRPLAWEHGRGFELYRENERIGIVSAEIVGDTVRLRSDTDLGSGELTVAYAMASAGESMRGASGAYRWGQLRDSDPLVGVASGVAQPNYAVSFELDVPG